jgi:hypothetical protein
LWAWGIRGRQGCEQGGVLDVLVISVQAVRRLNSWPLGRKDSELTMTMGPLRQVGGSVNQPFVKGLDLCELFYKEAVKPILAKSFPDLVYSAALIGLGSEVLGFDTPQSVDHDWGPRLMLFLAEADHETYGDEIDQVLRQELPGEIHGYPTNFGYHEDDTTVMTASDSGPINHGVMCLTVHCFFNCVLGFDPTGDIRAVDWVSVPEYRLLMLTSGRVFHDGLGQLEPIRTRLRYYPDDVWLYLLAAQWRRMAQEEAFMGRCGQVCGQDTQHVGYHQALDNTGVSVSQSPLLGDSR